MTKIFILLFISLLYVACAAPAKIKIKSNAAPVAGKSYERILIAVQGRINEDSLYRSIERTIADSLMVHAIDAKVYVENDLDLNKATFASALENHKSDGVMLFSIKRIYLYSNNFSGVELLAEFIDVQSQKPIWKASIQVTPEVSTGGIYALERTGVTIAMDVLHQLGTDSILPPIFAPFILPPVVEEVTTEDDDDF